MRIIIHRGAKEIGGICVELEAGKSRILIDLGIPLVTPAQERFDARSGRCKNYTHFLTTRYQCPDIERWTNLSSNPSKSYVI